MPDPQETDQNTSKNTPNLSKIDKATILIAKDNPTLNNNQIGKKLVDLGISKNHKAVHNRWHKSDYLRRELTEVRNQNLSEIQRKLVPKSLKKLNKQLHNEDDKIQMQAIQTTLKYGMGEMVNAPSQVVNVGNIEKLQIAISGALSSTLGRNAIGSENNDN